MKSDENTRASCKVTSTRDRSNVEDSPSASRTSANVSASVNNRCNRSTRSNRKKEYELSLTRSGRKLTRSTTFRASSGNRGSKPRL